MSTRRSFLAQIGAVVAAAAGVGVPRIGDGPKPTRQKVAEWVSRKFDGMRVRLDDGDIAIIEYRINWGSPGEAWLEVDGACVLETKQWLCKANPYGDSVSYGRYLLHRAGEYRVRMVIPEDAGHHLDINVVRR